MITPIEIRQHTFKKSLRGYDKDEVQSFLNSISMEWEALLTDSKKLKIELEKTQSNLDSLKKVESVLHKTLLQAEQTSKSTIENAKKDAELKVKEADNQYKHIVEDARQVKSQIEREVQGLLNQRSEILQQMKMFLDSQTSRVKQFEEKEMKSFPKDEPKAVDLPQDEASFFDSNMESGAESTIVNEILDEL